MTIMRDSLTQDELELLDRVATAAIDPVAPPIAVRETLLATIRATPQLDTAVPGEHESATIRTNDGAWKALAPGTRMRRLRKDEARKTVTFLLELDPFAVLPAHDHTGAEDSYVIRGSCFIGALGLAEGDFHHVEASARHGDLVASADGCLLLITSAMAA